MLEVESCSRYEWILESDSKPVSVSFNSCTILKKSAKLTKLLFPYLYTDGHNNRVVLYKPT